MSFMKMVEKLAESFTSVFGWATSEDGRLESRKRNEGERLKAASDEAYEQYHAYPTEENWNKYEQAKQAHHRWSTRV